MSNSRILKVFRDCVAGLAVLRSRLIEEDTPRFDYFREFVTFRASDIFVPALQSKRGALVVVEKRRFPLCSSMAFRAARRSVGDGKLSAMRIRVTALALRGSRTVRHVFQRRLQIWRAVAAEARDCAVCAGQRELRRGMIELRDLFPGLHGMASFATRE